MKEYRKAGTVRFTVTVESDAFCVLERYCRFMGMTKSHMINQWLVETTDSLNDLLDVAEKVREGAISQADVNEKLNELKQMLKSTEALK